MKTIYPNYDNCLTNLSNSILKYYGLETSHSTLNDLDDILIEKKYKNIVVILYDGMGSNLLKRLLGEESFLYKHKLRDINAVFPPTTTASTTSVLSGKNPNEHGWLGWDLYFKNIDKTVSMFPNTLKDTDILVSEKSVSEEEYPYESIIKRIGTKVKSTSLFPFKDTIYKDLDDMLQNIEKICNEKEKNFIYAYYDDPDHTMHLTGTDSKETLNSFTMINKKTEKLCKKLKDTLVIIIADHGHINSSSVTIKDYKDLFELLERNTSIEPRACSFKVKKGKEKLFEELFNNYLGEYFELKTKKEIIDDKLFGTGENNKNFEGVIGDFIAIAIKDKYINYDENGKTYLSMHAGITEDEVLVPLIIYKS